MALALLIFGFAFVAVGVRNTQAELSALIGADFSGANSFWTYIAGIFAAGAIGYYPPMREASRLTITLIVVVLLLDNQGVFEQLQKTLAAPPSSAPTPAPGAASPSIITGGKQSRADQATQGAVQGGINAAESAAMAAIPGGDVLGAALSAALGGF